jgi:ribosomal-protein-serine acetyltransferase
MIFFQKQFPKTEILWRDKSRRCFLRVFSSSDAASLFLCIERNRTSLSEFLPWVPDVESVKDTKRFIDASLLKLKKNGSFDCGIWVTENDTELLVGSIGFHPIDWHNKSTALGYWLSTSHRGNGLIHLSASELIRFAFQNLKLHRIEIRCAVQNKKSRKVPEKLGFAHEGICRHAQFVNHSFQDHCVYSLLFHEWQNRV